MGGATHSLVDIVEGFNGGEETVLMPLIDVRPLPLPFKINAFVRSSCNQYQDVLPRRVVRL